MTMVLAQFVRYLITFIIFIGVAFAGAVCGKKLRINKNKKMENESDQEV